MRRAFLRIQLALAVVVAVGVWLRAFGTWPRNWVVVAVFVVGWNADALGLRRERGDDAGTAPAQPLP